jgi:DNA invertase Pin-like site-specific DNA recombinase
MKQGEQVGYIRVSSHGQKSERQLDGVHTDKTFIDHASGKDVSRPQLDALMDYVREGDTVVVHSMDRLARNLVDLRQTVNKLTERGVNIRFVQENLTFTGEDTPMANLLLSVMGAFAEFERSLLRERQLEGIAKAKARGAYKGHKPKLTQEQIQWMRRQVENGRRKSDVAQSLNISRETLYQYLKVNETT